MMNLINLIPSYIINAIGWTLIHTLWQGALIAIIVAISLKVIPARMSNLRYSVACAAMAILFILSVGTFFYVVEPPAAPQIPHSYVLLINGTVNANSSAFDIGSLIGVLNSNMTNIFWIWIAGVAVFAIRFGGGLLYIHQLKKKVFSIDQLWIDKLDHLRNKLGVKSVVRIFESVHISKPMVFGYLKPIIILPIGMLTGLPTQQIESILIHELVHIKRHDFLVNLIQSLMEIIFFFNPFVWILSSMVRREREFCCDDQVISAGSMSIDYVKALASLEEGSYRTPALAMALGKNKFQVFNRIKRIMEKSVNNEPNRVRPAALLILVGTALACASWLAPEQVNNSNIGTDVSLAAVAPSDTTSRPQKGKTKDKTKSTDKRTKSETESVSSNSEQSEDTSTQNFHVTDDEGRSASYSRKVITTYDEEGNPHEEVIEEYDGDEDLRNLFSGRGNFSFTMPAIPNIPSMPSIPTVPAIPSIPAVPFGSFYYYDDGDSTPGFRHFSHRDQEDWEEFGRQMEENFEKFGKDSEEFGRMMEAWAEEFSNGFHFQFDGFDEDFDIKMDDFHERMNEFQNSDEFNYQLDKSLEELERGLRKMKERMRMSDEELKSIDKNFKQYEAELSEQLIKDGYLKKGEKVESMSWGDDKLTVNGIRIKDSDVKKYETLSEKFFDGKRGFYIH
ncbi:MAG: M56 family metallopeptidase [Cyclobacteriaceae bacterium]